jgi:hypothetical protein
MKKDKNCNCGECSGEHGSSYKITGDNLIQKIKELIHEGNVRKIVIKDEKGTYTYLEIPVTIGVIGTVLLPVLAAVGALAAIVGLVTVEVVKVDGKKSAPTTKKPEPKTSTKKK